MLPICLKQTKKRVAERRWVIVGGMWIQSDMNTLSGESFARQFLYSQRYFYEKFGKIATVGYNVDSFGHNAALPQIYSLGGIRNYVWMRPDLEENPKIPSGSMIWEGIDGTKIHAFRLFKAYNFRTDLEERLTEAYQSAEELGQPIMLFYGVGNHSGGPTIENLRQIRTYQTTDEHGNDVTLGSPNDFFETLEKADLDLPLWRGELQHHASGCYSTHSASKLLHRKAENCLLRMEKLGVLSERLTGHKTKSVFVRRAWDNLMFNEFHDIMGGCSIRPAMDDCMTQLSETISIAQREDNALLQKLSWAVDTSNGNPVVREKGRCLFWQAQG